MGIEESVKAESAWTSPSGGAALESRHTVVTVHLTIRSVMSIASKHAKYHRSIESRSDSEAAVGVTHDLCVQMLTGKKLTDVDLPFDSLLLSPYLTLPPHRTRLDFVFDSVGRSSRSDAVPYRGFVPTYPHFEIIKIKSFTSTHPPISYTTYCTSELQSRPINRTPQSPFAARETLSSPADHHGYPILPPR